MSIKALDADTRSLDQLYEAAQKESGPLIVSSGGDGMPAVSQPEVIVVYADSDV